MSRKELIELAYDNPINIDIAEEYGDFPSRAATTEWIRRQEVSGTLRCVGMMRDALGRLKLKVYCNGWEPKHDNLRHEVIGTRIRLLYPQFQFLRGYNLTECLADMVMTDMTHTYEIEIDCGTMKQKQVRWRWKRHKCAHDKLVITAPKDSKPEDRLRRLLSWSDELENAYFTTLERLQTAGPHSRVWDFVGRGNEPLVMVSEAVATPWVPHTLATPETSTGSKESEQVLHGN